VSVVHLLRHGEVYNPDGVLYGRLPGFQLSLRGRQQAEVAAKFLAARPIGYLVASPLERAQQTAAPLAAALGLPIATDDRLIEAANQLEGKKVAGGKGLLTDTSNWKYFRNPVRPSWGEPYDELAQRMLGAALAAAAAAAALPLTADGSVPEAVCVSHQLPIYSLGDVVDIHRRCSSPRRICRARGSNSQGRCCGGVATR
jgi:broad specificity phosphatase PhoE